MRLLHSPTRQGALALAASLILGGAACSLVAGLDKLEFTDPAPCAEACDDANPCAAGKLCAVNTDCVTDNCVDGVCCSTPCAGTCVACILSGLTGTCSNIPSGQSDSFPAGTCTGTNRCNGLGACKLVPGQPCTQASACLSNLCAGNLCQ